MQYGRYTIFQIVKKKTNDLIFKKMHKRHKQKTHGVANANGNKL